MIYTELFADFAYPELNSGLCGLCVNLRTTRTKPEASPKETRSKPKENPNKLRTNFEENLMKIVTRFEEKGVKVQQNFKYNSIFVVYKRSFFHFERCINLTYLCMSIFCQSFNKYIDIYKSSNGLFTFPNCLLLTLA